MKKERGITLIALIVTIIILIILAGITIALISGGDGILAKATATVDKNNIETAKEQVTLKIGEYQSDYYEGRYVTLEIGNQVQQGDWIYTKYGNQTIDTKNYQFKIEDKKDDKYVVTIIQNRKLPGNVTGTLSVDGKLEWEEVIVADSGSGEKDPSKSNAGDPVDLKPGWGSETIYKVKTANGDVVEVKQEASVYAVSDGNGEVVPVPNGFWYVGGTVDSGVVISDYKNDQNKYAGEEDVPAGVAYKADGTVDVANSTLKGNQFVWIPCTANEYVKKDWGKANATWERQTNTAELPQIEKYGGFYVGRYEAGTSNINLSTGVNFASQNTASDWGNNNFSIRDGLNHTSTGKITTKAGEIPYYHADYFTALKLSNSMYNNNDYVRSGLVTGTMWDAMMKFIAGNDNGVVTSSAWGNYTNGNVTYTAGRGRYAEVNSNDGAMTSAFTKSDGTYHYGIKTTAISEDVKKKNLYDVAGNLWEWTQEAAYDNTDEKYIIRGGSFTCSYAAEPACYRGRHTATYAETSDGFRPVLYIK